MVDAAPFRALRYDPAIAGEPASTSAPSYDDLGRFVYAQHRAASPYTVLELLAGTDDADGYRAAGASFRRWLRTGVLVEDDEPAFYLYEIHELRHGVPAVLRGVVAAVFVTGDSLLPHEGVDPERITRRVARITAVPADLAPVFAVHTAAAAEFRALVDARPTAPPVIAFTDELGADHRVWAVRDADAIAGLVAGLRDVRAVIADGHHRFAAAKALHERGHGDSRTLTYLVDGTAYGPQLRGVHRLVAGAPADLAARLDDAFVAEPTRLEELDDALASTKGPALGLHLGRDGTCLLIARDRDDLLARLPAGRSEAWRSLDSALFEAVVRPLLGDATVVYRGDLLAAAREMTPDDAVFVLRPPPLESVYACAAAGEAMPPKSTWFRPKPRAGLVMRSLQSDP